MLLNRRLVARSQAPFLPIDQIPERNRMWVHTSTIPRMRRIPRIF